jgi:hypothetical protein
MNFPRSNRVRKFKHKPQQQQAQENNRFFSAEFLARSSSHSKRNRQPYINLNNEDNTKDTKGGRGEERLLVV